MGIPQSQQTACRALHWLKNAALSFSNWRVVLRILGMWSPPCKCFVPESDRLGWNALLSSWLYAVWRHGWLGSDRWYLRFPPALPLSYRS